MRARVIERGDGSRYSRENRYEMVTDHIPSPLELEEAQHRLGFNPLAYGGPDCVISAERRPGEWVTVWSSGASCE